MKQRSRNESRTVPAVVLGDLSLVRPLNWAGIPVVMGTDDLTDPVLWSRHVRSSFVLPGYGAEKRRRSAEVLAEIGERLVQKHGARIPLIYGQDAQLAMLYEAREKLSHHYCFVLNEPAVGRALLDKEEFARLCVRKGVRTPRTCRLDDVSITELGDLRPPLLVKPKLKTDWHRLRDTLFDGKGKARLFDDAQSLLAEPAIQANRNAVIVQEYVDGPVDALCSFHGFTTEDGRLLASFCGRKVKTYPRFAGESAVIELLDDPQVAEAGREVMSRLGVVGPFKIDLVRDRRSGELVTLEVNARFNLWNHLGAAHGVNLLEVAYDYLLFGREPSELPYQPRRRWVSFYRNYRGFKDDGASRPSALARWAAMALRRPSVHDVFDWRDPVPFVSLLAALLGKPRQRTVPALVV
jgi:predicted ATP-grasp superfamily ATP-dependent carboligase